MLMSAPTDILVTYLPVVLYLTVMTLTAVCLGWVPVWVHPALIVPGLVVRSFTATDWSEVAVAAGAGAMIFLAGVFFLARTVSGATLFTVAGALTLAPLWWGHPGILAGLVSAGMFTGWRTARRLGGRHVQGTALQILFAFGVSPGGLGIPDPEALPGKRPVPDDGPAGNDGSPMLSIQPFLLVGVLLSGTLHALLA
jgi:hypothetical protein